jgi:hypothetical protein
MEKAEKEQEKVEKPQYEPPKVVTYSGDDLLEEMGPAQSCTPSPCPFP